MKDLAEDLKSYAGKDDDGGDNYLAAIKELVEALKKGDAKLAAKAFRAAHDECMMSQADDDDDDDERGPALVIGFGKKKK